MTCYRCVDGIWTRYSCYGVVRMGRLTCLQKDIWFFTNNLIRCSLQYCTCLPKRTKRTMFSDVSIRDLISEWFLYHVIPVSAVLEFLLLTSWEHEVWIWYDMTVIFTEFRDPNQCHIINMTCLKGECTPGDEIIGLYHTCCRASGAEATNLLCQSFLPQMRENHQPIGADTCIGLGDELKQEEKKQIIRMCHAYKNCYSQIPGVG